MKATLTSINPPHTDDIFENKKTIEWRTYPLPKGLHYIYETKRCFGLGLVIGTLNITKHYTFNSVDEIPDYLIETGCVPREFLEAYAKGRKLFANVITEAKKLYCPKYIYCYTNYTTKQLLTKAPQRYTYIEV